MATSVFIQQVFHVFKKLYMSALVTCYSNTLHIFLNSAFYNICHASVMPQVNDLCTLTL